MKPSDARRGGGGAESEYTGDGKGKARTYSQNTDGVHGELVDVGETHDGGLWMCNNGNWVFGGGDELG